MDEIIIENLRLRGKHGCLAKERDIAGEFAVSMRLFLDVSAAAKTDSLEDTIDYPQAMAVAEGVFAGESVRLIETLAEAVAERLFARFGVLREAEVEVEKLGVDAGFSFGKIAVKIRRSRADFQK